MEIFEQSPQRTAPAERFTGEVKMRPVASPREEGQRTVAAEVRFQARARTAWHRHANGQSILVTEGVCLAQAHGGPVQRIETGQTAYFPADEVHWHGASPDGPMTHLALTENAEGLDAEATTTWLEHVTDEEYAAGANARK